MVFNEEKTKLIKWFRYQPGVENIVKQVLIVDADSNDWLLAEKGFGGVDFLPREIADSIIEKGVVPTDILKKCLEIDRAYEYEEFPEIKNKNDIKNLDWASGNFHDAFIEEQKLLDNGTLYLLFNGVWGCKIEVWLWGDLKYNIDSRGSDWWYGSSIIFKDGYIYFIDEEDMTVDKIDNSYCWFKARHMKYHIIPD